MALELTIPSSAPALCTFEVAHFTELISLGPPARYRLTRQSLEQALEWGYSAADVHLLLGRLGGQPLPAGVSAALHGWRDTIAIIESEPGYRLRASGAGVLAGLRKRRPFRQRTSLLASRADAWVPAACAHELFRYLRRVGYQVKESRLPPFPAVQNGPRPSGLPLASLLVVLRTYRQLRELIPGLAVLDELREVEGESAAALIPDDLAVVERLVESHRIFLRHHLKRDPGEEAEEEATEQTAEARAEGRPAAGRDAPAAGAGTPALPGPQVLEAALQAAIAADRRLEITYADTQGHCTHRTVRPLHLEERWGNAYLLAFCELRQDERHFRLDRIVEARPV